MNSPRSLAQQRSETVSNFRSPLQNGIEICLCEDPRGGETGRTIEEIALKQDIGEVTVRMALWCVANKVNSFLNEYEVECRKG